MFQEEHGDFTYMEHIKVPLIHGSLLLMEGASQADWQVNVITVINRGGMRHVAVDEGASQADWQVYVIIVINTGVGRYI